MSKKAEARIARSIEKKLRQQQKSARLRDEPDGLAVRSEYAKEQQKTVRAGENPNSVFDMQMRWTAKTADKDGEWTWKVARDWGDETWQQELEPKLLEFEKLTWAEIDKLAYGNAGKRHRMHHSMPTDEICGEAKDRLNELGRTTETLFRFRLGNLPRLWGERIVDEFQIYWYDPTHKIYPVD